jgi:hypothetical protein
MSYYFLKGTRLDIDHFSSIKTVFKSAVESPKFEISSVGDEVRLSLTGFVLVNKCPRERHQLISRH